MPADHHDDCDDHNDYCEGDHDDYGANDYMIHELFIFQHLYQSFVFQKSKKTEIYYIQQWW